MKIAFFSDSYFPEIDGVTYTLKLWKKKLEERGHEVYIVYPKSSEYEPGEGDIPVKSLPNPFYSGYRMPLPTMGRKLPEGIELVHCHSPATLGVSGRFYAWKKSIPSVYTHHTPLEEYFIQVLYSEKLSSLIGKIYVRIENLFLKSFDAVTSNMELDSRSVNSEVLPVGVDMDYFKPKEEFVPGNENMEGPLIGYSGRLSNEKNIEEILKLAREVDYRFLLVGKGPQREKLEKEAPENVSFHDFLEREKLPGFYSAIDVFVTASTGDTLGLSTLEANACGTPVLAVDSYPFDSTIMEENGLRYAKNDTADMKTKLEQILSENYSTRQYVQKYSMKRTIDRLESLYREVKD